MMIHGMWGGGWCWENYKNFFEGKGYQCITPTLRFHDMEPNEPPNPQLGTTRLLDYFTDLEKEINQLDAPPILMGHSMGGLLAQMLGSRGLAKAIVLLNSISEGGIIALRPSILRSFWNGFAKWGFWRKPMCLTFGEAVYGVLQLLPAREQREVFSRFVYESGRAACEIGFRFLNPKRATKIDESRVGCPVLVITGGQDRITPASVMRSVSAKYRTVSTYKEFPNHAHWIIGEPNWQEVAEYISDWLDLVLSAGGSKPV